MFFKFCWNCSLGGKSNHDGGQGKGSEVAEGEKVLVSPRPLPIVPTVLEY